MGVALRPRRDHRETVEGCRPERPAQRYRVQSRYGLWYLVDAATGTVVAGGVRCHAAARALAARLNAEPVDLAAHRTLRDPRCRRDPSS